MLHTELLLRDLSHLYEYLLGAHHASDNPNSSEVFHQACHRIQDIMNGIIPGGSYLNVVEIPE